MLYPAELLAQYSLFTNRGERIRTSDTLLPKQVRYQAALRPGKVVIFSGSACPSLGSTPVSLPQVMYQRIDLPSASASR